MAQRRTDDVITSYPEAARMLIAAMDAEDQQAIGVALEAMFRIDEDMTHMICDAAAVLPGPARNLLEEIARLKD